jgi:hypothetical protein
MPHPYISGKLVLSPQLVKKTGKLPGFNVEHSVNIVPVVDALTTFKLLRLVVSEDVSSGYLESTKKSI